MKTIANWVLKHLLGPFLKRIILPLLTSLLKQIMAQVMNIVFEKTKIWYRTRKGSNSQNAEERAKDNDEFEKQMTNMQADISGEISIIVDSAIEDAINGKNEIMNRLSSVKALQGVVGNTEKVMLENKN